MDTFLSILAGFFFFVSGLCAVAVVLLLMSLPAAIRRDNTLRAECEAKGGVVMNIKYEGIKCFSKGSLL